MYTKNMKKLIVTSFAFLPILTWAQTTGFSLQNFIRGLLSFINDILIPTLFGIAFLIFVINVIRFFVIQGNNEDGRKNAKALAIYSVSAFLVLIIFWGIVSLLARSIGLEGKDQPCPDYIKSYDPARCP